MFTRGLALCLTLAFVSVAQAGAVIELVDPLNPMNAAYMGGETITVDYSVSDVADPGRIHVRMLQFDMNESDPALVLNSFEFGYVSQAICRMVPSMCGSSHAAFVDLADADGALVAASCTVMGEDGMSQMVLPFEGAPTPNTGVGHLSLTLPAYVGPGEDHYMLDVMNVGAFGPGHGTPDPTNNGARIKFGFGGADPMTTWTAPGGDLTGGMLDITVIPEPATLVLLALGGVAALRRRRAA